MGYLDHVAPVKQSFEGEVISIEWNARDHNMPMIKISGTDGKIIEFSSNRIVLGPTQLKSGDTISKQNGSKMCNINDVIMACVN